MVKEMNIAPCDSSCVQRGLGHVNKPLLDFIGKCLWKFPGIHDNMCSFSFSYTFPKRCFRKGPGKEDKSSLISSRDSLRGKHRNLQKCILKFLEMQRPTNFSDCGYFDSTNNVGMTMLSDQSHKYNWIQRLELSLWANPCISMHKAKLCRAARCREQPKRAQHLRATISSQLLNLPAAAMKSQAAISSTRRDLVWAPVAPSQPEQLFRDMRFQGEPAQPFRTSLPPWG